MNLGAAKMTLEIGSIYHVKVIKLLDKAIVVRLLDNSTELIHVSKIANAFVKAPEEYVSIDDEFDAVGVKGQTKPVELSLRHLDLKKFNATIAEPKIINPNSKQKPKQHSKLSQNASNPPKPIHSKLDRKLSLDEMIKKSNKQFEDKFRDRKDFTKKNKNRRKNKRPHKED